MTSAGDYDPTVTDLCERMLVTVIGNAGFWGRRLYLVVGLVPRYLHGHAGGGASAHVGSRDVDLAVILMVDDPISKSYETLARNLRSSRWRPASPAPSAWMTRRWYWKLVWKLARERLRPRRHPP